MWTGGDEDSSICLFFPFDSPRCIYTRSGTEVRLGGRWLTDLEGVGCDNDVFLCCVQARYFFGGVTPSKYHFVSRASLTKTLARRIP